LCNNASFAILDCQETKIPENVKDFGIVHEFFW